MPAQDGLHLHPSLQCGVMYVMQYWTLSLVTRYLTQTSRNSIVLPLPRCFPTRSRMTASLRSGPDMQLLMRLRRSWAE